MQIKFLLFLLFAFILTDKEWKSIDIEAIPDEICSQIKDKPHHFKDKTIFEGDTLNGRVKTVIEDHYNCNYNHERCDTFVVIRTFDENGLLLKRQGFGQDITYFYEETKLVKSSICFSDDGKEYSKNDYLYDENGNLILHIHILLPTHLQNFSDSTKTYYSYNRENQLIEEKKGQKTTQYKYDQFNNLVYEESYQSDLVQERIEYRYRNHRLEEKQIWTWFEGMGLYYIEKNFYNTDGTLKMVEHYTSFTKDTTEKLIGKTFYQYIYDNKNEFEHYQINNAYDKSIIYSDFDSKGNWQTKTTYYYDNKEVVKRKFEYFE